MASIGRLTDDRILKIFSHYCDEVLKGDLGSLLESFMAATIDTSELECCIASADERIPEYCKAIARAVLAKSADSLRLAVLGMGCEENILVAG